MSNLVVNNSGLIWSIVKRFTGRGYENDDLYQIGCLGLIKAIKRFDTSLDIQLSTYAVPYILGEIKRFIRDDGIIKVSRSTKELAIKIKMIQKEYLDKNGVEININQIAEILKLPKEELAFALESTRPVDSIYEEDNKGSQDERKIIDKLPCNINEAEKIIDKIALRELISELDDREKQIILLRFYKEQTQSQVGKTLGITQVQVSRIEKKVLERMKLRLEAV